MNMNSERIIGLFRAEKISPSITVIEDITGTRCLLVEGKKKAVLIDTCSGAGNLKVFVDSLTSLPLTVILTHGHGDHAGGAAWFDEVYLSKADWSLVEHHASMDMKMGYVSFTAGEKAAQLQSEDYCPVRTTGYLDLKDGMEFDLGDVELTVISIPGHTKGMACILNRTERTILFGDACNPSVFMWDEEAATIEEYRENLQKLKGYEDQYDTVILSHGPIKVDKSVLDEVIQICGEIMAATDDAVPFAFMDYQGLKLAKKANHEGRRLDGKIGNIVYNPKKVFKEQR